MFSFFLEERVGRKEPDWFDCKCLNKLQHEAASLHKQIHRKQKVGYLWKLGKNFKTWKRRLFVLDERLILRYYVPSQKLTDLIEMEQSLLTSLSSTVNPVIMKKLQEEIKKLSKELAPLKKSYLKGSISLIEGETEISLPETTTKVYKTAYPFKIITNSRNLVVCAEDVNSRRDWVRLLSTKIQKTPTSFKKFPQTRAFHGTTAPFRPLYQSSVKDQLSLLLAKELSSVIRSSISC